MQRQFKIVFILGSIFFSLLFLFFANTNSQLFPGKIYIQDEAVTFSKPVMQKNGVVYVPATELAPRILATVEWNSSKTKLTFKKRNLDLDLQVLTPFWSEREVILKKGTAYVPIEKVVKFYDARVDKTEGNIKIDFLPPELPDTSTNAKFEPRTGIYLGAYILQDEVIKGDMSTFNRMTGKKHATFFKYVGYGEPFPKEWVEQVKKQGAFPHIAFEPNNGLAEVKDDAYLRKWAKDAGASKVPILLRFASEMNGTWVKYSGDPELYKEKWRLVHRVMQEEAPNVAMLWSVFTHPERTIPVYYPGDEYVDWVGVNIYNVIYHNNNVKERADFEDPLMLLEYVYRLFGWRKPIAISEYGATHYTVTDNKYYVEFAKKKISRMYANLKKYPRVKAIYYFDVNNLLNAPAGRKINNYSIIDNPEILAVYRDLIKDDYFLSGMDFTLWIDSENKIH